MSEPKRRPQSYVSEDFIWEMVHHDEAGLLGTFWDCRSCHSTYPEHSSMCPTARLESELTRLRGLVEKQRAVVDSVRAFKEDDWRFDQTNPTLATSVHIWGVVLTTLAALDQPEEEQP